ncbi:MAG: NUDIX domain-containing protein [Candidatus Thiodiazotropha sp.]
MTEQSLHEGLEPQIRNAVRAVILRDGAVLMQKKRSETKGEWYTLPGGGQNAGETLEASLIRECEEELGVRIKVGELLTIADTFKPRETAVPSTRHVIEIYYACQVPAHYHAHSGDHPDKHQVDVVWLPIGRLAGFSFQPNDLVQLLPRIITDGLRGYLGEIG